MLLARGRLWRKVKKKKERERETEGGNRKTKEERVSDL